VVSAKLFWGSVVVQAITVGILFAALLPLGHDFFESWGVVVGPVAWLACSYVTGRVLKLPISLAVFSAVAGGVAGGIVMLAASHTAGMVAALLVFGASCGGYDPERDPASPGQAEAGSAPAARE
jgi:hypothetical protein